MALSGAFGSARFRVVKVVLNVLRRRPKKSHARLCLGYASLHHIRDCDIEALALRAGGVVTGRGGRRV